MLRFVAAACIAALPAAAAAKSTELGKDWPDILGRWSATAGIGATLPVAALDIVRCGKIALCGHAIGDAGRCGPAILRLEEARTGTAYGTIALGGRTMRSYAARQGGRIVVGAHPPRVNPGTRAVLPLVAEFEPAGAARCGSPEF